MDHLNGCSCSRRSFLKGSGLTLAGVGTASLFPRAFIDYAMASGPFSQKKFLFIFLRGGMDGINVVIPYGDTDYNTTNRPSLYIPPASALTLNGFAKLHPKLQDLVPAYNAGDLAIVHRVGFNNTRSHFDDQRVWENGNPSNTKLFEGWLYRYIRENAVSQGVSLPVLTAQPAAPLVLSGAEPYVNIANPDSFDYLDVNPKRAKYSSAWRQAYASLQGLEAYRPLLADGGVKLVDFLDEYRAWDQLNWDPKDPNTGWSLFPVSDATNPPDPSGPNGKKFDPAAYPFFRSLKVCSLSFLESDASSPNGTRVAGTELGSFDTHDQQGQLAGSLPSLLSWLAYGMASLRTVFSGAANDPRQYASIWNDVVVATMSEFGRTSKENGSLGTDHAQATALFAMGGPINGAVYNCDPSTWPAGIMFGVDGRYLLQRTEYRAVFWEILRDHMGADPSKVDVIFPGYSSAGLVELGIV